MRKLISRLAQILRKQTTYEIRRQRAKDWLPFETIETINIFLPWYRNRFPGTTLMQVGAYDGEKPIAVWKWAQSSDDKMIVIEPMKMAFEKLSHKYRGFSNVSLCNAAVGWHDGQAKMFVAKNIQSLSDIRAEWSSFRREHLLRLGVKEDQIRGESVQVLRLETILDRFDIDDLDVLIIDTEGFDNEVIKMALEMKTTPNCIYFEHTHFLNRDRITAIFSKLHEHGYRWVHDKRNTLAVKEHVLDVLHSHLPENKYG